MTVPRRLWLRFRTVGGEVLSAYREAVAAAGVEASGIGAHFWAFAVDGEDGRFVEFLEGPSDEVLARLDERTRSALDAASGSACEEAVVGPDGERSTELRGP